MLFASQRAKIGPVNHKKMAGFADYITLAEHVLRTVIDPDPNIVSWTEKN